jgi:lipopolysaccharide biosynthesis regulator YciM
MFENILIILVILFASASGFLAYERFFNRRERGTSETYLDAMRDLLDGLQESAFTKLRQVVSEDSENIDAYLRLGRILREHGRPERALQVHKEMTLRGGLDREQKTTILKELTLDYIAQDDLATAEKALKELIGLDGKHRWAHKKLLDIQEKQGKWTDCYDTAAALLKLESSKSKKPLARFKYHLAQDLHRRREYHKARIMYKEALGLDPRLVEAYLAVGDSYTQESRLEDAANFWGKLISAVPEKGHIVIERLEKTLFDLGRYGDIVDICESILEHDPKNTTARRSLAGFYQKKGELDMACEQLEKVLDDDPDSTGALVQLIRLYRERGDLGKIDDLLRMIERRRGRRDSAPGQSPAPDTTPVTG